MADNKQMTDAELGELAQLEGNKLAILIASLNVSDQVKKDLVNVLPFLAPEQLVEFTQLLENLYAHDASQEADVQLEKDLQRIKDEYVATRLQTNEDTLKALEELEKQLPKG